MQAINADGSLDPVKKPATSDDKIRISKKKDENNVNGTMLPDTVVTTNYQLTGLADGDYQVHVDTADIDVPVVHSFCRY